MMFGGSPIRVAVPPMFEAITIGSRIAAGARFTRRATASVQHPSPVLDLLRRNELPAMPPGNLWERIRKGFAMPNLETRLADNRTQWYASQGEYIDRMARRSQRYLLPRVVAGVGDDIPILRVNTAGVPAPFGRMVPLVGGAANPVRVDEASGESAMALAFRRAMEKKR